MNAPHQKIWTIFDCQPTIKGQGSKPQKIQDGGAQPKGQLG